MPGLSIEETEDLTDVDVDRYERPVYFWHRINHGNFYMKAMVGHPDSSDYPPIDILFRSPIDSVSDIYVAIMSIGQVADTTAKHYCVVRGASWGDLPQRGTLRFLTRNRNMIWRYDQKAFTDHADGTVMLLSEEPFPETSETVEPMPGEMSLAVVLHEDYETYCCRLEFSVDNTPGNETIQLQFKVGILDMTVPYEEDITEDVSDSLIKGFKDHSYTVSRWFTQNKLWAGPSTTTSDPSNFVAYQGGYVSGEEKWNKLEIMCRDDELWIWWNEMLVAPSPVDNLNVYPEPVVSVSNPYFDIGGATGAVAIPACPSIGKVGFRLWPGAKIRQIDVRDQAMSHNELQYGQLEVY